MPSSTTIISIQPKKFLRPVVIRPIPNCILRGDKNFPKHCSLPRKFPKHCFLPMIKPLSLVLKISGAFDQPIFFAGTIGKSQLLCSLQHCFRAMPPQVTSVEIQHHPFHKKAPATSKFSCVCMFRFGVIFFVVEQINDRRQCRFANNNSS